MDDLPWQDGAERMEQVGHEKAQHPNIVAVGDENDDGEPDSGEVLLVDEIAVNGHKDVEFGLRLSQEVAIQLAGPAVLACSRNCMACSRWTPGKSSRNTSRESPASK